MFNFLKIKNSPTGNCTSVICSEKGFKSLAEFLVAQKNRIFVFADGNFFAKEKEVFDSLISRGVKVYPLPSGEQGKNFRTAENILKYLAENGADKNSLCYAVGGGVTGDIVGFACSVYMRGLNYVNVPTTLLSMCDSSVGGKTAIDFGGRKNLIGTFHPPITTIIMPSLIEDISTPPFNEGISEILKCGMLGDLKLYNLLKTGSRDLPELIYGALKVKKKYVEKDFLDKNERRELNLGHTFAHAAESISDFKVTHGQAVGMGLILSVRFAVKAGVLKEDFSVELKDILNGYGLPCECPYALKELIPFMLKDKKCEKGKINLVLPVKKGKCKIIPFTEETLIKISEIL